jgi:hypothetical protein
MQHATPQRCPEPARRAGGAARRLRAGASRCDAPHAARRAQAARACRSCTSWAGTRRAACALCWTPAARATRWRGAWPMRVCRCAAPGARRLRRVSGVHIGFFLGSYRQRCPMASRRGARAAAAHAGPMGSDARTTARLMRMRALGPGLPRRRRRAQPRLRCADARRARRAQVRTPCIMAH